MPFLGNASGHDFQFHVASWMEAARQWHAGILYPRWAEWANWGFGEPRFIFYPPASWMMGAAMGFVLPWRVVPGAFIWLAVIAAGLSMRKLAGDWLAGPSLTVAAVLYAANPYQLVMIYYRSDFAELLAGALFPLVLWGAVRVSRGEWRKVPLLALIFAGVWLSNAPAAVMATYSLALAIAVGCVLRRSLQPLFSGAAAMAGGFGLAAFYILPAAWEQRWVQIGQAVGDNLRPAQNFLFTRNNLPEFIAFNRRVSWVALGAILVTVAAAAFAARRSREKRDLWWIVAAVGAAAIFLMLPLSAPLWRFLPQLRFMQFPWRWLEAMGVAYALFIAAAAGRSRGLRSWLVPALVFAATVATATTLIRTGWWDAGDVPEIAEAIRSGHGYEGTDEYMPLGGDRYQLPGNPDDDSRPDNVSADPAPEVAMLDSGSGAVIPLRGARVRIDAWSAERKIISVESAAPVQLAPRLLVYPAWQVEVDGRPARYEPQPATAQMLIPLQAGIHRIDIRFTRTWDRTFGGAISLATVAALLLISLRRYPNIET